MIENSVITGNYCEGINQPMPSLEELNKIGIYPKCHLIYMNSEVIREVGILDQIIIGRHIKQVKNKHWWNK